VWIFSYTVSGFAYNPFTPASPTVAKRIVQRRPDGSINEPSIKSSMNDRAPRTKLTAIAAALLCGAFVLSSCGGGSGDSGGTAAAPAAPVLTSSASFPVIQIDPRFKVEKVAAGLTYATGMAWDDQGRLHVLEAGGGFTEETPPARILRVEPNGQTTVIVDLADRGVADSAVGLAFFQGAFYVSHRDPRDRSGAVSRVTPAGSLTTILTGILDSQSEHQVNDLRVGPDGRMYLASGPATNSGVVGLDLAPFVSRSPMVHARPCQDIVLTGQNFQTPDFRTPDPSDTVRTGAFVPFGTETTPGQVVRGVRKRVVPFFPSTPATPKPRCSRMPPAFATSSASPGMPAMRGSPRSTATMSGARAR